MRRRALLLTLLVLLAPLAAGQGHEHGPSGGFLIVADAGPEGRLPVGGILHASILAVGDDPIPDFHQDVPVRVLLNDRVIYETDAVAGHDYDGVHDVSIRMAEAGAWRIEALSDGKVAAELHGTVEAVPSYMVEPVVDRLDVNPDGQTWIGFHAKDARGDLVPHTDITLEILRGAMTVMRLPSHAHDGEHLVGWQAPSIGDYQVRLVVTAANQLDGAFLAPAAMMQPFSVPTMTPSPAIGAPSLPADPTARNQVAFGTDDGTYRLIGTYDPSTIVGPGTLQHLGAALLDGATGLPVGHVNFDAHLSGPNGVHLSTSTHGHAGLFRLATMQEQIGFYELTIDAWIAGKSLDPRDARWRGSVSLPFIVAPPVLANVAGPQVVTMTSSGDPLGLDWTVRDLADRPFAHGELDVQFIAADGVPALTTKLHTHASGDFGLAVGLPGGSYDVQVTPFPLDPQPVTAFWSDATGAPLMFSVEAPAGAAAGPPPETDVAASNDAPVGLLALLGIALAALVRRR